ncbi:hypothetical protein QTN25_000570 [Entamoeba marina]
MNTNTTTLTVTSVQYGSISFSVPKSISYVDLVDHILKEQPQLNGLNFSIFYNGKPIESDIETLSLSDNCHMVIVVRVVQKSEKMELFEKNSKQKMEIEVDEPNLTQQEINRVFDLLNEQQKNEILILTEIGFDQENAFNAFCMSAGNNEVAVEMLLGGLLGFDYNLITTFICNKYPDAIRQIRPGLLRRRERRGFAARTEEQNIEDFLFQTLMAGGRLQDILGPLRDQYNDEN